jgi:hypothetical protein
MRHVFWRAAPTTFNRRLARDEYRKKARNSDHSSLIEVVA